MLSDQPKLFLQSVFDFLLALSCLSAAVAAFGGLAAQVFQVTLESGAIGDWVVWEPVGQVLGQIE